MPPKKKKTLSGTSSPVQGCARPPASLNKADWKTSKAKQVVAQDIIDGVIPMKGKFDSFSLCDRYCASNEWFRNFPFDQTRCDSRIKSLQETVGTLKKRAEHDSKEITKDLQKHPPKDKNARGEQRWEGSDAQKLLKEDMDNGLHLNKSGRELWLSRGEHMLFGNVVFMKHIDEEKQTRKEWDPASSKKRCRSNTKLFGKDAIKWKDAYQ